jgi:teichuronic acid biosynthesis glycosyltransferase TuaC
MMRVLIVTNLYPNSREPGRGIFVKQQVSEMKKACDIRVIAPLTWRQLDGWLRKDAVPRREVIDGIEVLHPRWFVIPKMARCLYGWLLYRAVVGEAQQLQKSFDFDVIDSHWVYPDGFAAVVLGKRLNKPVVVHALGCDINLYARFPVRRRLIVWALRNARKTVAVSAALGRSVAELGVPSEKISVRANGVNTDMFRPLDKAECRRRIGFSDTERMVLFIGRLEEEKGLGYLIQAIRLLVVRPDMQDVRLLLIGSGSLEKKLIDQAKRLGVRDRILFIGSIEHGILPIWLNACDVFCLPSIREGMPNVIVEALACGKPVVATEVGGIPELINSLEYGILAMPGNPESLAAGITAALNRDWDSGEIAKKGMARSWQKVSREIMADLHGVVHSDCGANPWQ